MTAMTLTVLVTVINNLISMSLPLPYSSSFHCDYILFMMPLRSDSLVSAGLTVIENLD